jgi:hypothetical protein
VLILWLNKVLWLILVLFIESEKPLIILLNIVKKRLYTCFSWIAWCNINALDLYCSRCLCWWCETMSTNCGHQQVWCSAMVEWYWQGKTKEIGEELVPMSLCLPHIPHGLTHGQTQAFVVRGLWLTALAMVLPLRLIFIRYLSWILARFFMIYSHHIWCCTTFATAIVSVNNPSTYSLHIQRPSRFIVR